MAVNEQIVTGKKYRTLIDVTNKIWQRISFWTKSSDVEFDDGDTAEIKVGAVKGITTDLNTTETGYAADMTTVSNLNRSLEWVYQVCSVTPTKNEQHFYSDYFEILETAKEVIIIVKNGNSDFIRQFYCINIGLRNAFYVSSYQDVGDQYSFGFSVSYRPTEGIVSIYYHGKGTSVNYEKIIGFYYR